VWCPPEKANVSIYSSGLLESWYVGSGGQKAHDVTVKVIRHAIWRTVAEPQTSFIHLELGLELELGLGLYGLGLPCKT
jgi:hypothetical protein